MRFYKNELPNIDDLIICRVKKIDNDAIYVSLVEYDNIEGMIQLANASVRRKKKSICLLKENKQYTLLVISVDKEKGYIDLSNKFLSDEDKNSAMEKYDLYKKVLKIFNNFMYSQFENNYDDSDWIKYAMKTIWTISNNDCYTYLSELYYNNSDLLSIDLTEEERIKFKMSLEKFFGSFLISTKLNFILRNPNYGGVDNIKLIFDQINNEYKLITKSDTVPLYIIENIGTNKDENENILNKINNLLENKANEYDMIYSKKDITSSFI